MCGITITTCSNSVNLNTRVKPKDIQILINQLIKYQKKSGHLE